MMLLGLEIVTDTQVLTSKWYPGPTVDIKEINIGIFLKGSQELSTDTNKISLLADRLAWP